MNQTAKCPLHQMSLLDPNVQDDPYEFYERLQREEPVYRMPETGFYVVTRYDDVRAVLGDTKRFSNNLVREKEFQGERYKFHEEVLAREGWPLMQTLQRTDPPVHGRYRRLVDRVFTPKQVQVLKPEIEALVNRLIDKFIDKGECEFVHDFALMLPGLLIAEQIGLGDDILTFKKWVDAMFAPGMSILNEEEIREVAAVEAEAQQYFAKVFEERRKAPQDDLMSQLLQSSGAAEDEAMSMQELQSLMRHIVAAGFETTASAISSGMLRLLENPDQMAKLRANRALMPKFVDEVLRIDPPAQGHFRRALEDLEIAGVKIPKGSIVIPRFGAANHDESMFACPHAFDIERPNANRHFAFGNGIHFCIGANLARQEISIAFSILLDRMEDIEQARPMTKPIHQTNFILYFLKELPIKFRKVA